MSNTFIFMSAITRPDYNVSHPVRGPVAHDQPIEIAAIHCNGEFRPSSSFSTLVPPRTMKPIDPDQLLRLGVTETRRYIGFQEPLIRALLRAMVGQGGRITVICYEPEIMRRCIASAFDSTDGLAMQEWAARVKMIDARKMAHAVTPIVSGHGLSSRELLTAVGGQLGSTNPKQVAADEAEQLREAFSILMDRQRVSDACVRRVMEVCGDVSLERIRPDIAIMARTEVLRFQNAEVMMGVRYVPPVDQSWRRLVGLAYRFFNPQQS